MKKSREERLEAQEQLLAIHSKVETELKKVLGVLSVGIGVKEVNNELTDTLCFRVYVKKKRPKQALSSKDRIPEKIKNVPTDVIEASEFHLDQGLPDTNEYRPLYAGSQINTEKADGLAGTLGCFATLDADGTAVLLSNHHILGDEEGVLVGQPSKPTGSWCCTCGEIAKVVTGADTGLVDCAIARLEEDVLSSDEILQIGPVFSSTAVVHNETVRKYGRTTGYTEGTVVDVNFSTPGPVNGQTRTSQILMAPKAPFTRFANSGDSGAAVLNESNQVIGLHMSSNVPGTQSFSNNIANVIAALDITINSAGTNLSIPLLHGHTPVQLKDVMINDNFFRQLEARLKKEDEGKALVEAFYQNQYEVLELVNSDRAVKIAWHRYQGPTFMSHMIKKGQDASHRIPDVINGVTLEDMLLKMSAILEMQGSTQLAKAIDEHFLYAFNKVHDIVSGLKFTKSDRREQLIIHKSSS